MAVLFAAVALGCDWPLATTADQRLCPLLVKADAGIPDASVGQSIKPCLVSRFRSSQTLAARSQQGQMTALLFRLFNITFRFKKIRRRARALRVMQRNRM